MNAPVSIEAMKANYARIRRETYTPRLDPIALPKSRPFRPNISLPPIVAYDAHIVEWHKFRIKQVLRTPAKDIQQEVCEKYGLRLSEITSQDRSAYLQPARREMAYRLKNEAGLSYPEIGRRMGGRDHSTSSYHVKMHEIAVVKPSSVGSAPCDYATLKRMLDYDPKTGVFTWRSGLVFGRTRKPGTRAGCVVNEYCRIGINGSRQVGAHLLAWFYMTGNWPVQEVDHKDNNPTNNAFDNLRLATSSQQKMNRRVQSNNRSGLKGAFYHSCRKGKKWRSQIKSASGKLVFLGYYATAEEAHEAYCTAAPKYHGEFARFS